MSISLLYHFEKFFNAFELTVFIRDFCRTCILIYTNGFNVTVIEGDFYATMQGKLCGHCYINKKKFIFFKDGKLFYVNFKSYLSLPKSPKFMKPGVLKYAYNTLALKAPNLLLSSLSTASSKPHCRIKFIFYTPQPSLIFQLLHSTVPI